MMEQVEQQARNASVPPAILQLLPREMRNDADAIAAFFAPAKNAFAAAASRCNLSISSTAAADTAEDDEKAAAEVKEHAAVDEAEAEEGVLGKLLSPAEDAARWRRCAWRSSGGECSCQGAGPPTMSPTTLLLWAH
jgi:hypothetical protein